MKAVNSLAAIGGHRRKALLGLAALGATMFALAGTASASGYGGKAQYQVGFSFNCDNASSFYCSPDVFGLGGEWGWYAFNSDGTFDAQITFCRHGQLGSGAGHVSEDGIWTTGPAELPLFGATSDFYISLDGGSTWQDTTIPSGVGHYAAKLAPGVSAEAQVAGG